MAIKPGMSYKDTKMSLTPVNQLAEVAQHRAASVFFFVFVAHQATSSIPTSSTF